MSLGKNRNRMRKAAIFGTLTAAALIAGALFIVGRMEFGHTSSAFPVSPAPVAGPALSRPKTAAPESIHSSPLNVVLPAIQPVVSTSTAAVIGQSAKVFAYAHGTAVAGAKMFIGMAATGGNRFSSNEAVIVDRADISHPVLISLKDPGEIDTAVYDRRNDRIYFLLSGNYALKLYAFNPHTYAISTIVSTTSVDAGRRPAIVTDGSSVYGITNTDPSSVFRVDLKTGQLAVDSKGHIPNGHSAAIGVSAGPDGSATELYFGGDMTNGFEKTDAKTLAPLATETISPCGMTNDMPFAQTSGSGGYVYIGCESVPYGIRVKTADMSYERYALPGASFGQFIFGGDLYNAAQDGCIDVFARQDLAKLVRYRVTAGSSTLTFNEQSPAINEILYVPGGGLYFTAWYGVEGLYSISTSTLAPPAVTK